MNRLPSYDKRTSQIERGLFLSLSLAAFALIVVSVTDVARVTGLRGEVPKGAAAETAAPIQARMKPDPSTNLSSLQPEISGKKSRLNSSALPKS